LPFVKRPCGALRGPAFFRQQFLIVSLVAAGGSYFYSGAATVVLLAVGILNLAHIVKFTPVWPKQSPTATPDVKGARDLSLLSVNVKQSNRAYDRLTSLILDDPPDLVLAVEVDDAWIEALSQALVHHYPHWIRVPQDNTYGICVMSRFPLSDVSVRQLVTEGVPSIRATVSLNETDELCLFVVHPDPPVLHHDTIGRDSEIALIGLEVRDLKQPVIVAGDLNDVAWSTTTRRFQRLSGLCDPRVGRGFYNTFHAHFPIFRWPLDHLYHSPRFHLVEMKRLPAIGSDHFPIYFRLRLTDAPEAANPEPEAHPEERKQVRKMITKEQRRPRDPIGADWEDT
jgi:endonuclease/exonuclease/phosphatase (EEP) superfamily protein YafD